MSAFHKDTVTILQHVLSEQRRDLALYRHRLKQADAGASAGALDSFRRQISMLTAIIADLVELLRLIAQANAEAAFEEALAAEFEASGFVTGTEAALRSATVPAAHDVFGNHILDRAQARLGESVKHDVRAAVFADLMFEPIVSGEAL